MGNDGGQLTGTVDTVPGRGALSDTGHSDAVLSDTAPLDDLLADLELDLEPLDPERYLTSWDVHDSFGGAASDVLAGLDAAPVHVPSVPALALDGTDDPTPSAGLAQALSEVDLDRCLNHQLLEAATAWRRVESWVQAGLLRVIAELARRPDGYRPVVGPDGTVADDDLETQRARRGAVGSVVREFVDRELAAQLHVGPGTAGGLVTLAAAVADSVPAAGEALAAGRIDLPRARVISERTSVLPRLLAREVAAEVVDEAADLTPVRLRKLVDEAVVRADAKAAARRTVRAREARRFGVERLTDGMCEVWAQLPAADALAIETAVQAAAVASRAARLPGDERTMEQRRADAFAAPFLQALATGVLDGAEPIKLARLRGRRAAIAVTVPLDTLRGASDEPGDLAGYGPIDPHTARSIAADPDATWRRLVTDPTSGAVLDVGRTCYRPPADLARYVEATHPTCTAPGCDVPVHRTELDHVVPFPEGPTAADNLRPLCKRHHRWKQTPGMRVETTDDGGCRWTTPTGHVHVVPPTRVGPVRAPEPEDDSGGGSDTGGGADGGPGGGPDPPGPG